MTTTALPPAAAPAPPATAAGTPEQQVQAFLAELEKGQKSTAEKVDAICKQFAALDGAVKTGQGEAQAKLDALQKQVTILTGPTTGSRTAGVPGCNEGKDKGRFSFLRAMSAIGRASAGDPRAWVGAEFELDIFKTTGENRTQKALTTGVDTAGGYLVPTQYVAEIIELLRAELVVEKAGATFLPNLTGSPVEIPSQTGAGTAYWTGENVALTSSQQTTGKVSLQPRLVTAYTKLSRRSAALSNPSLEQLVRQDLASELALAIDKAALIGPNAAADYGGPTGVKTVVTESTNSGALGTGGVAPFVDQFVDLMGVVQDANAWKGKLAFITNPKYTRGIIKQKIIQYSTQSATAEGPGYVMAPFMTMGGPAAPMTFMGIPIHQTTQVPVTAAQTILFVGNWADLLIGEWGGLELEASTQAADGTNSAFTSHQIWIKAVMEADVALRRLASFAWYGKANV